MTPIRVLHRRALAHRPRTVHYMKAQLREEDGQIPEDSKIQEDAQHLFTLEVETQGGE